MKKIFSTLLILSAVCFLSSCKAKKIDLSSKTNIVCTIFPQYDWVRNLCGDSDYETTLSLIVKNGVDLHSYQPSAQDMVQISTCDIFIYIGGESDQWVKDALKNANNENTKVINLMEVLKDQIKEEKMIEGMQSEGADENSEESEEIEYDEHIWLSIKNAQICCKAITDQLCEAVPQNAQMYTKNLNAYLDKLSKLDLEYKNAVAESNNNTILVCDRFPFRYLADDYNLNYYAAFTGCSSETEASFETVSFLSNKLNELKLTSVFTLEHNNQKIARTVIANAKKPACDILVLDSMQSTTLREAFNGTTYCSIMQNNLENLKKGLQN